jgi:hypothetical protein
MRQRAAKVFLLIAIIWFLLGGFVYNFAPFWFSLIAAVFAIVPVLFGIRLVRILGIGLIVGPVVVAAIEYKAFRTMQMDSESIKIVIWALAFALAGIAVFIAWYWLFAAHAKSILRKWAAENNYEVISCSEERFLVNTGPFKWWTNSRGQIVYSIRVRCHDGSERSRWVRCGSYLGGVLCSGEIEARWDDPRPATG